MSNEADTCRKFVLPKLYAAGWTDDHISEQKYFTDGRVVTVGNTCISKKQKRADYLLRYRRDFPVAIVEAKANYKNAADFGHAEGCLGRKARGSSVHAEAHRSEATLSS